MNSALKIVAVVLLVAGTLSLAYGGFTYVEETHDAEIGPLEITVQDKERVNIPVWVGVLAVASGAGLLLVKGRPS